MKKIILFILLFATCGNLFSQQTDTKHHLTKQDYLTKGKHQKSAAWALLIGGTALMGAGFLIGDRKESSFDDAGTGVVMGGVGLLADIGSIPLFIASGKNKRRAEALSASLIVQGALAFQKQNSFVMPFPAISLKVRL